MSPPRRPASKGESPDVNDIIPVTCAACRKTTQIMTPDEDSRHRGLVWLCPDADCAQRNEIAGEGI